MSSIVVKPLTHELGADFLRFFDHERGSAFADNQNGPVLLPLHHVPRASAGPALTAEQIASR
jgi:hypothetical protein